VHHIVSAAHAAATRARLHTCITNMLNVSSGTITRNVLEMYAVPNAINIKCKGHARRCLRDLCVPGRAARRAVGLSPLESVFHARLTRCWLSSSLVARQADLRNGPAMQSSIVFVSRPGMRTSVHPFVVNCMKYSAIALAARAPQEKLLVGVMYLAHTPNVTSLNFPYMCKTLDTRSNISS
jgi:hypothetical protein